MTDQHSVKAETEYAVLAWTSTGDTDNDGYWTEVGMYRAKSANEALKQAAEKHAPETMAQTGREGAFLYVAVPSRSWQPKFVKARTETTFEIDESAWSRSEGES